MTKQCKDGREPRIGDRQEMDIPANGAEILVGEYKATGDAPQEYPR